MAKKLKQSADLLLYRAQAEAYRRRAGEYRRLADLTEDREVQHRLQELAFGQEHYARVRDDWAVRAEYGHLYGEQG